MRVIDDDLVDNAVIRRLLERRPELLRQHAPARPREGARTSSSTRVLAKVRALKVGDPLDPATQMGSMITKRASRARARLRRDRQARKAPGSWPAARRYPDFAGYFVQPTVFDQVTPEMRIAREEIFGPVLGVLTFSDPDEALKIATDTDYGLHATVFTKDIDRAIHFARRLPCGTVSINSFSEGDVKTPFGGYRRSGSLARDNGTEAMDQYQQTKTIWISTTVQR